MGTAATTPGRLTPKQWHGRVSNAVAELFRRELTVPEIYLKPRSPGFVGIDVLAVDHSGSGDLHGAEIITLLSHPSLAKIAALLSTIKQQPTHYKYLALPEGHETTSDIAGAFNGLRSFNSDGIGRIGLMTYSSSFLDDDPLVSRAGQVRVAVRAERFLLRGDKLAVAEHFLSKHQPDMRVRL